MFYCEGCRAMRRWPKDTIKSFGKCEFCGEVTECYDLRNNLLTTFRQEAEISTIGLFPTHAKIEEIVAEKKAAWKNYLSQKKAEGIGGIH